MHPPIALVVRVGLHRTFGSLAGFAALGLLSLGIYLLADAFAHPVDAGAAGVIVAAFAIAVSMLLFIFIFDPRRLPDPFRRRESARIAQQKTKSSTGALFTARHDRLRSDLPYQRTFVDRSSIRPRTPSPVHARGIAGK
jgi:hypothetical protein